MKLKRILATVAAAAVLTVAGSSIAFASQWVCPAGYDDCQSYDYCVSHSHEGCYGYWADGTVRGPVTNSYTGYYHHGGGHRGGCHR